MDFEKFLNKKILNWGFIKHPEETMNKEYYNGLVKGRDRVVEKLGEWAWEIVSTTLKEANYKSDWDEDAQNLAGVYGFFEDDFSDTPVLEIAVACLGEKEVKRRLVKI